MSEEMPDKSLDSKYLVVANPRTGMAELANVGIFKGISPFDAASRARKAWGGTSMELYAKRIKDCEDGWSFYT